jgi:hypothetical protein
MATLIAIPLMTLPFTWDQLATSLLFIPYPNSGGAVVPLFGVGWTLNFEMFFYALFALALFGPRWSVVPGVIAVLTAMVITNAFGMPAPSWLKFLSDPIVLEFAFGMLVALAYRRNVALPVWLAFAKDHRGEARVPGRSHGGSGSDDRGRSSWAGSSLRSHEHRCCEALRSVWIADFKPAGSRPAGFSLSIAAGLHSRTSYSNATPSGSFSLNHSSAKLWRREYLEVVDVANFLCSCRLRDQDTIGRAESRWYDSRHTNSHHICRSAVEGDGGQRHHRGDVMTVKNIVIPLEIEYLQDAAKERGISRTKLVRVVMEKVVRDELVPKILDDHDLSYAEPPRQRYRRFRDSR